MHGKIGILLLCLLLLLVCTACGKAAQSPAENASAAVSGDVPSVDPVGMKLIEVYAQLYGGSYTALAEGFQPENYIAAEYFIDGEAHEEYVSENPELVSRLYKALSAVTVGERYEGMLATDSGSYVGFVTKDGEHFGFSFDIGCPSIKGVLYECSDDQALRRVESAIYDDALSDD